MNTTEQLAQALRGLLETDGFMPRPPRDGENHNHLLAAWQNAHAALAAHEAEKAQAKPVAAHDESAAFEAWAGRAYRNEVRYTRRDYSMGLAAWLARGAQATPAAPVAVPLTDEELRETLKATNYMTRNCVTGPFWPELEQACRAIERTLAARWGVKLEGGQG